MEDSGQLLRTESYIKGDCRSSVILWSWLIIGVLVYRLYFKCAEGKYQHNYVKPIDLYDWDTTAMVGYLSVIVVFAVGPGRAVCSKVSVNTVDVLAENNAGRQVCDCPSALGAQTVCEAEMGIRKRIGGSFCPIFMKCHRW